MWMAYTPLKCEQEINKQMGGFYIVTPVFVVHNGVKSTVRDFLSTLDQRKSYSLSKSKMNLNFNHSMYGCHQLLCGA